MFTMAPPLRGGGGADPYGANVALLVNFEGGFTDSSTYARTLTTTGSPTISSASPAFGTGCGNFTGGAEQYVTAASDASLSAGTGKFTLELQLYPKSFNGTGYFFRWGDTPGANIYIYGQAGTPYVYALGNVTILTGLTVNVWNQITILRDATDVKVYIGTTEIFTTANTVDMGASIPMYIGAYGGSTKGFSFIDEVRLTIGVARTPAIQTAPFPKP